MLMLSAALVMFGSGRLSVLDKAALLVTALIVQSDVFTSTAGSSLAPPEVHYFSPKKSQSFYQREKVQEGSVFSPRNSVVIEYDHVHSPANAIVSFNASGTYPIVAVGAFDDHLKSITCTPIHISATADNFSTIDIKLDSQYSVEEAFNQWKAFEHLHFVTSHPGCNLEGELGAWRVISIDSNPVDQHIKLHAQSISLHELGTCNVLVLGHVMSSAWPQPQSPYDDLARRKLKSFDFDYGKDFSGTELLSSSMSLQGISSSQHKQLQTANLDIQCLDCRVGFNFTVDLNVSLSLFDVSTLSIAATVNDFNQTFLLGFSVGATNLSLSYERDLLNFPLLSLGLRDIINIGPEVGVSAGFDLDLNGELNFTTGARATIDPGTWAKFDFLTQTESDEGWDSAKLEFIPLRILGGSLNSTMTMKISPFIGIGITLPINDGRPLIEGRVSQNAPSINFSANVTDNVNRNCQPVTDDDFESFPKAVQLSADMTFETRVGIVGSLADLLPDWNTEFSHGHIPLFNRTGGNGTNSCLVVVDDSVQDSTATSPSLMTAAPTGTLMAAISAVPSFDVSKIESYFSANGQLPTNVDYSQLLQATTVPDDIKNVLQPTAHPSSGRKLTSTLGFVYYTAFCSLTMPLCYFALL